MRVERWKKVLTSVGALVAAASLLAGCAANTDTGAGSSSPVVIGGVAPDVSLDPHATTATDWLSVLSNMYDTLVVRNTSGKLVGSLAKEWKQVDATTWQISLHEGVTFHDGSAFTANDVKFSLERVTNPANKLPQASYIAQIKSVDVVDTNTVRLNLKNADPLIIDELIVSPMISQKYVEANGPTSLARAEMGTGPYQLVSWDQGGALKMKAYDKYWGGKPKIPALEFMPYPDAGSLVSAVQAGQVDLAVNLTPDLAKTLPKSEKFKTVSVLTDRTIYLILDTQIAGLNDVKVRRALNLAIDRKAITQQLLSGYGQPVANLLADMYTGYNSLLKWSYNPDEAKKLLKEAGFTSGLKITLNAPSGRYPGDKAVAEAIVAQWQKIGVDATLSLMEYGTLSSKLRAHDLSPAYMIGYGLGIFDSARAFLSYFGSASNNSYTKDPVLDKMISAANIIANPSDRNSALKDINKYVYDNALYVPLYQQSTIYAKSSRLDWKPRADERIWMFDASVKH